MYVCLYVYICIKIKCKFNQVIYLVKCQYRFPYVDSSKTKFRWRIDNYKWTHKKFRWKYEKYLTIAVKESELKSIFFLTNITVQKVTKKLTTGVSLS